MTSEPVLVVKVGWMEFYRGSVPGDERPLRGGSYNWSNIGHEVCNFHDVAGRLRGYTQPPYRGKNKPGLFALERVAEGADDDDLIDGVTVAFVATLPSGGEQVVVGWYRGATVHRECQKEPEQGLRPIPEFFFESATDAAVLLPVTERLFSIPMATKDGMGQTTVFYPLDRDGNARPKVKWLSQLGAYIDSYAGENVLDSEDDAIAAAAVAAASTPPIPESAGGQGYQQAADVRRAVEMRAMDVARGHFEKQGKVSYVHSFSSYDILVERPNGAKLRVEVKGSQGSPTAVQLTIGEVKSANGAHPETALAIVSNIVVKVTGKGKKRKVKANAGNLRVIQPWRPEPAGLKPIVFQYKLPPV